MRERCHRDVVPRSPSTTLPSTSTTQKLFSYKKEREELQKRLYSFIVHLAIDHIDHSKGKTKGDDRGDVEKAGNGTEKM